MSVEDVPLVEFIYLVCTRSEANMYMCVSVDDVPLVEFLYLVCIRSEASTYVCGRCTSGIVFIPCMYSL